jgi:hypothetical protein
VEVTVTAPTLTTPALEMRRLRAELAAMHRELTQLRAVAFAADPTATPEYWRALFADAHRADLEDAYQRGREDMAREYERDWAVIARPVARGGPAFAELELRRWGVRGEQRTRQTFGQPHAADYMGGPVSW